MSNEFLTSGEQATSRGWALVAGVCAGGACSLIWSFAGSFLENYGRLVFPLLGGAAAAATAGYRRGPAGERVGAAGVVAAFAGLFLNLLIAVEVAGHPPAHGKIGFADFVDSRYPLVSGIDILFGAILGALFPKGRS